MASFKEVHMHVEVRPEDSSGNEIFGSVLLVVISHCSDKKQLQP